MVYSLSVPLGAGRTMPACFTDCGVRILMFADLALEMTKEGVTNFAWVLVVS